MYYEWNTERVAWAAGLAGLATGAACGYLAARRKYQIAIDDISEVALKAMQDLEISRQVLDQTQDQLEATQRELDALDQTPEVYDSTQEEHESHPEIPASEDLDVVDEPLHVSKWLPEDDAEARTGDGPYILHQEEFETNYKDYRQVDVTWYDQDKILADDNSVPIYNPDKVVGHLIFGRGSDDPDVCYVRNDANKAEYRVTRVRDSYMRVVQGIEAEEAAEEDELRHSQGIRKFRQYRD
jgi:hypothetical protein